jgi:hypothetical protein
MKSAPVVHCTRRMIYLWLSVRQAVKDTLSNTGALSATSVETVLNKGNAAIFDMKKKKRATRF